MVNGLIWPIIFTLSIATLSLIGIGIWLIRAEQARTASLKTTNFATTASPLDSAGLDQRPPARTPLSAGGAGCMLVFGLFWVAFSLIFMILPAGMFYSEWQTYHLLKDTGKLTEGVITGQRIDEDSEGDTYYVTYKYTAPLPQGDRQSISIEESVGFSLYNSLPVETRVMVRYSPADPTVSKLEAEFAPRPTGFY
jgi:hypothetical protein